jgi:hypothetical protein
MNRIARVTMALIALTIPVASIAALDASAQASGVISADKWCC